MNVKERIRSPPLAAGGRGSRYILDNEIATQSLTISTETHNCIRNYLREMRMKWVEVISLRGSGISMQAWVAAEPQ